MIAAPCLKHGATYRSHPKGRLHITQSPGKQGDASLARPVPTLTVCLCPHKGV